MRHRNITTRDWSRMAIDSLFERGKLLDWQEFAQALRNDRDLASNTLAMCERHADERAVALARVLVEHFHPTLKRQ